MVTPEDCSDDLDTSSTSTAGITGSLFLTLTIDQELISTVINLKDCRTKDMTNLHIIPIKHRIDVLTPVLYHIFNLAISTGLFPE